MSYVECVKCEWCDHLTPTPRSTGEISPILALIEYPASSRGKDFCNRECFMKYIEANPGVGAVK